MRKLSTRPQRTLARTVTVRGIGYLTGKDITVQMRPAPVNTGIVFVRTDLSPRISLSAVVDRVTGTNRRTTLGHPPFTVALVEHAMSALAGLRIDNCYLNIDGPELPGLDGSSQDYVDALHNAGVELQSATKDIVTVPEPVIVRRGGATLSFYPAEELELRITYVLNYGQGNPLTPQRHTQDINPESFGQQIAGARTFLLEEEALELKRQGLGKRSSLSDLLVFGQCGVIDNTLRFADEPARHKLLDILGDLSLSGMDFRGHIIGYRSGHPLNVELVREIQKRYTVKQPQRMAA